MELVKQLHEVKYSIDEQLQESFINLFSQKKQHEANERFLENGETAGSDKESDDADVNSSESSDDTDAEGDDTLVSQGDDSGQQHLKNTFTEQVEFNDGRIRRKAIFGNHDMVSRL